MELRLERSDYAKVAAGASAAVLAICLILACVWYLDKGFDVNTIIAISCAVVCAVILCFSVLVLSRSQHAEVSENVEIIPKFVPGDEKKQKAPEKPATEYKMPKH